MLGTYLWWTSLNGTCLRRRTLLRSLLWSCALSSAWAESLSPLSHTAYVASSAGIRGPTLSGWFRLAHKSTSSQSWLSMNPFKAFSLHKIKCGKKWSVGLLLYCRIWIKHKVSHIVLQRIFLSLKLKCCTIYMIKSIECSQFAKLDMFSDCLMSATLQNSFEGSSFSSGLKTCFVLIILI